MKRVQTGFQRTLVGVTWKDHVQIQNVTIRQRLGEDSIIHEIEEYNNKWKKTTPLMPAERLHKAATGHESQTQTDLRLFERVNLKSKRCKKKEEYNPPVIFLR
jgi:hypothetical protein